MSWSRKKSCEYDNVCKSTVKEGCEHKLVWMDESFPTHLSIHEYVCTAYRACVRWGSQLEHLRHMRKK